MIFLKKIINKILGFSLGPVIAAVVGFITVPIVSFFIDADQFGLASMFTVLNNALTIIVLVGFDQAYMREYNEINDKSKLFINALFIPFVLTIFFGVIIFIFRNNFALWLFDDYSKSLPIICLIVSMPLFLIERFFLLMLRMQEKGFKYSIWSVVSRVLNLVIVVILLKNYKSTFESVIYASLLSQIITSFSLIIFEHGNITINFKKIDKTMLKRMLSFGLPILPATCMSWALSSMDLIFLRTMSNYTEVGIYSMALKFVSIMLIVQASFTSLWAPIAFKWYKENQSKKKYEMVTESVSFIMILLFGFVLLFKNMITLFISDAYYSSIFILPFLLFYPVFYTISETITVGISFSRKTYYNMFVSFISLIVNLFLNYTLIPIYGGKGAAFATGISYLLFFWLRTIFSRKVWYKFPIIKFVILTIESIFIAVVNSFVTNFLIVSIVNTIFIFINIVLYFNVILYFLKRGKIYVGLICCKTQEKQLINLINCGSVKCIECINQTEHKFIKYIKFLKIIIKCDVVYYGYGECNNVLVFKILKIFNKKVIVHWIGSDILSARKKINNVELIQKNVDLNIGCSELITKELLEFNIIGETVPILPQLDKYKLSNVPKEHAVLSYIPVGNESFYGIKYIEVAAKLYPKIMFYIVGSDNDILNIKNVKFLGRLSPEEMISLYDKVSLLIRLPDHDGLSLMLIEALLKGKNVLYCYDFPHCYKVNNETELKKSLLNIFSKKPSANIDGRNYVLEKYDFSSIQLTLNKTIIKILYGDVENVK